MDRENPEGTGKAGGPPTEGAGVPAAAEEPSYFLPNPRTLGRWLLIALPVAALLLGIGIPEWRRRTIANNERAAYRALGRLLITAEADFRSMDLDGNKIQDFWTGDVSGLYRYGLIPRELAEADAAPLAPLVSQPVPYEGYYLRVLVADDSVAPPEVYAQVTDPASGKVHHKGKFGFVAYPAQAGVTGTSLFIVNENNTVFPRRGGGTPPTNFPSDGELKSFYSKVQ